jgi:hypothetical protein
MSKKKPAERKGYGRLLDAWIPPEHVNEPIGCLSTSFTFDAAFFEEECLGRFLQLESDPEDAGAVYLIEREEKLSKLKSAAMIVDAKHCRGNHSLRWDLLLSRVPGGCQHAKVSLLHWFGFIRVIITSANMTRAGYCENQEIFGIMDWYEHGPLGPEVLNEVLHFLEEMLRTTSSGSLKMQPGAQRILDFLNYTRIAAEQFPRGEMQSLPPVQLRPIFSYPGHPDVLSQLTQHWPERNPPLKAEVVSPFFDDASTSNLPAQSLWNVMRKRGEAGVRYHVPLVKEQGDKIRLLAPRSLLMECPRRDSAVVEFYGIPEEVRDSKDQWARRTLHAKTIVLDGSRYMTYLLGSSNFTSKGLGLIKARNFEANLLYIVDTEKAPQTSRLLLDAMPPSQSVLEPEKCYWQPDPDETGDDDDEFPVLPVGFESAHYRLDPNGEPIISLKFGSSLPPQWKIYSEGSQDTVATEEHWKSEGSPQEWMIPWPHRRPPGGFEVTWQASSRRAWLPVNAEDQKYLLPPDELRNLPLDLLIEILISAAPLHRIMQRILGRIQEKTPAPAGEDYLDPHKRVETSRFLLQRVRRISRAFRAMRESLERPMVSDESLAWRLKGPVGVTTLAKAIEEEASSVEEQAFLLSELCFELSRVKPSLIDRGLGHDEIRAEIMNIVKNIQEEIAKLSLESDPKLKAYIESVFQRMAS